MGNDGLGRDKEMRRTSPLRWRVNAGSSYLDRFNHGCAEGSIHMDAECKCDQIKELLAKSGRSIGNNRIDNYGPRTNARDSYNNLRANDYNSLG